MQIFFYLDFLSNKFATFLYNSDNSSSHLLFYLFLLIIKPFITLYCLTVSLVKWLIDVVKAAILISFLFSKENFLFIIKLCVYFIPYIPHLWKFSSGIGVEFDKILVLYLLRWLCCIFFILLFWQITLIFKC